MHMYVCVHTNAVACLGRPEDNYWGLVFSLHVTWVLGIEFGVIRLSIKHCTFTH